SVAIQAVGAFWYIGQSDRVIYARGPYDMRAAWDPRNAPFVMELRHAPARMGLPACRHQHAGGGDSARRSPVPVAKSALPASGNEPVPKYAPADRSTGTTAAAADTDWRRAPDSAAASLRSHQQPAGFWLTSHTTTPRFANPMKEMNTYVTSVMIDLLDPVADAAGLADSLARARRHLTDQIESTGLIRYHGRPDGPTIPALGCVITPDSDDTALVWRIAPSSRQDLMSRAMSTLKQYRTSDGLYRTWLAPRPEYTCIDA